MSERVQPIRSELLAAKFQKLWNFELPDLIDQFVEEPRFLHALWFLEFVSKPDNFAGGLTKFSEVFIAASSRCIGTAAMMRADESGECYSTQDAIAIFRELSEDHGYELFGEDLWIFRDAFLIEGDDPHAETFTTVRFRTRQVTDKESGACVREGYLEGWEGSHAGLLKRLKATLTPARMRELCLTAASESLAGYLENLCKLPRVGFLPNEKDWGAPEYFSQVGAALLNYIEATRA